jgi:hypothetical protein
MHLSIATLAESTRPFFFCADGIHRGERALNAASPPVQQRRASKGTSAIGETPMRRLFLAWRTFFSNAALSRFVL